MKIPNILNSFPDCSVIVLSKDNPAELRLTLNSLAFQKFSFSCEVILIESWSDHKAFLSLLGEYRDQLSHFDLILHRLMPPAGIYPSMNFALSVFNGSSITFLNSGDIYHCSNSLNLLYSHWQHLVSNSVASVRPKAVFGQAVIQAYSGNLRWTTPFFQSVDMRRWLKFSWPCHQAVLFDGEWARNNPYNLEYGLSSDRYVMLEALKDSSNSCFCKAVIVDYSLLGASSLPPRLNNIKKSFVMLPVIDILRLFFKYLLSPFWFFYPLIMFCKAFFFSLLCFQKPRSRTLS